MPTTHLISGLGADKMAFCALGKFTEAKLNYVDWISNAKDESLSSYATRLIELNKIAKEDTLIGLSFGGLVAQEIANQLGMELVILISSFRDKRDLKPIFENLLKMGAYKLIPSVKLNSLNSFVRGMFNSQSEESKKVLNEMLNKTDIELTKWSIQKIDESDNTSGGRTKIYNIIGDSDKLVKNWEVENTYEIVGGGHFMVFENAFEITGILKSIMKTEMS